MKHIQNSTNKFKILKGGKISLIVSALIGSATISFAAPIGGNVVSGNATISQNGNITNINQSSNKAIINWNSFSIDAHETVNFNQPNKNSITLNRVIGNERSVINGALNANGQVWLVNSNGTLFGKSAKINTSGFLVTTKDISNEDFNSDNFVFKGDSTASIINDGEINVNDATYATFIANSVINNGEIKVHRGIVNLVGANEVQITFDENSHINLKVNKGVMDALVENNNLIKADGGKVYLTTNAKNELLKGVVNNTGVIEAESLDNLSSEVILFAHGGLTNIDGDIKAKGSFVETSGKDINVTNKSKIEAKTWLIDPVNVTIDESNNGVGGEFVGVEALKNFLNSNDQLIITADNNITVSKEFEYDWGALTLKAGNDIFINSQITINSPEGEEVPTSLVLNAGNDIFINNVINVNGKGKLYLEYSQKNGNTSGNYYIRMMENPPSNMTNGKINLNDESKFFTKKGTEDQINWTVIRDATALQAMSTNDNTVNYVLGKEINLSGVTWTPIGSYTDYHNNVPFSGKFDGLGHTISNLTIDTPDYDYNVGLFGFTNNASISNLVIENANIIGDESVGVLAGRAFNTTINNVGVKSGKVTANFEGGGLVGNLYYGAIINSYSNANVFVEEQGGGLVGSVDKSDIKTSYSTGSVTGKNNLGGFVGYTYGGNIENSYSMGNVQHNGNSGDDYVGSFIGFGEIYSEYFKITNSYSSGKVSSVMSGFNVGFVGGLEDYAEGAEISVTNSYFLTSNQPQGSIIKSDNYNKGKTSAEMQNIDTYKNNGWSIETNSYAHRQYPTLSWEKDQKNAVWIMPTSGNGGGSTGGGSTGGGSTGGNSGSNNTDSVANKSKENDAKKTVDTIVNNNVNPISNPVSNQSNAFNNDTKSASGAGTSGNIVMLTNNIEIDLNGNLLKMPDDSQIYSDEIYN